MAIHERRKHPVAEVFVDRIVEAVDGLLVKKIDKMDSVVKRRGTAGEVDHASEGVQSLGRFRQRLLRFASADTVNRSAGRYPRQ